MLHLTGASSGLDALLPGEAAQLAFRCVVSAFALDMALVLSRTRLCGTLARYEPLVYLAYLSHGVIVSCLWKVCGPLVGGAGGAAYPVFFLAMPLVVLGTARLMMRAVEPAPAWLRLVTCGRHAVPTVRGAQVPPPSRAPGPRAAGARSAVAGLRPMRGGRARPPDAVPQPFGAMPPAV